MFIIILPNFAQNNSEFAFQIQDKYHRRTGRFIRAELYFVQVLEKFLLYNIF